MRRALTTGAMWFIRWQAISRAGLTLQDLPCYWEHLEQMGSHGRGIAETEFSLDKVTAETLSVYQELLAHNQTRKLLGSVPKCPNR